MVACAPPSGDLRLLALGFTVGMLAVLALPQLPAWPLLASLVVPLAWRWRLRAVYAALLLGGLVGVWRSQALLEDRWPTTRHGEDVTVPGRIADLPERSGETWRFLFRPEGDALPELIRAAWYRTPEVLRGGECWRMRLRLRAPRGSLNPGAFDYEAWLFQQGIGATATVRDAERCASQGRTGIVGLRAHVTHAVHDAVREHPAAGLVAALAVGDRSGLTDADWDVFRLTGTTHLVAISGFNIAIVAGLAFFLARWLWSCWPALCLRLPAQRAALLGAAAAGFAYALLAGFEPPVQRAVIMLLVLTAALWAYRLTRVTTSLALAWLAVLLIEPFALLSPGLWLSFGAVAAIFYVSTHRVRTPGFWHSALFLQLMLALALAPLTLFFFQGVSWTAPLVNLVAVPLFVVLTPAVLIAVLVLLLAPEPGGALLHGVAEALGFFRDALALLGEQPGLWLPASPPLAALLLALCGVVLAFAPRGLPLALPAALCFVPLLFPPQAARSSGFELTALDVGQGLAVVVRTAGHTLLYDAGPAFEDGFDAGESVVVPFLLHGGVRRVDLLLLSHGDNDHAGGMPAVRKLLHVDRELGTSGAPACRDGQRWEWDGVRFELLHPDAGEWSDNNGSCVLKVSADGFTALLAGDIEAGAERRLVQQRREALRADVLIAPHHGSKTSSTAEFIAAVDPGVVVHSAGWRSHFRHPAAVVVERYAAAGARQYVTGNGGALRIARGEAGIEVAEWRRQARRFWNAPAE